MTSDWPRSQNGSNSSQKTYFPLLGEWRGTDAVSSPLSGSKKIMSQLAVALNAFRSQDVLWRSRSWRDTAALDDFKIGVSKNTVRSESIPDFATAFTDRRRAESSPARIRCSCGSSTPKA